MMTTRTKYFPSPNPNTKNRKGTNLMNADDLKRQVDQLQPNIDAISDDDKRIEARALVDDLKESIRKLRCLPDTEFDRRVLFPRERERAREIEENIVNTECVIAAARFGEDSAEARRASDKYLRFLEFEYEQSLYQLHLLAEFRPPSPAQEL